jgi:hypothetical protein
MLTLLLAVSLAQPPAGHEAANPLFKQLLDPGLAVGGDFKAKLPPPTMPDGLDAARQKAVVQGVIGNDFQYAEFVRNSVVAPQVLKLRDVTPSDPAAPARGTDVWFVMHGDFAKLDDDKFVERLANAGRGEGKSRELTSDELAKRKIPAPDPKKERFGQIEFDFLERVRLKATGRTAWSKTPESVVVAGEIDPRFRGDPEFPNQWQSLTKDSGRQKVGPATPWGGAAFYLKVTKLAEPAGAMFVEQHVVFAEPTGWFGGENLLRSKLPPVVQNNVRTMRREWQKAEGK